MDLVQVPMGNNSQNMTLAELLAQVNQQEQSKPVQERLAPEIIENHILNGINDGNKMVADWQTANNIRKPQTMEEIEDAKAGLFNKPQQIQSNATYNKSFLDNLSQGFNDNYSNPIAVRNFAPDNTKTWSNRLGEGLGTIARFIDSPAGRGLIAGGASALLGATPTNIIKEGLTASLGRQNAVTADKLYRQQLKQYGYTDEDLSKIRGNVTNEIYKNLSQNLYKTQKLSQDNYTKLKALYDRQLQTGSLTPQEYQLRLTALNNLYVNSNIATVEAGDVKNSNQTRMTDIQEQLLPYKQYALQTAPQVALGNLGVNQGNLGLQNAKFEWDKAHGGDPTFNNILALANHFDSLPEVKNFKEIERQYNNVADVYSAYKNGKLKANASDQAMITTLNKILDPTSVVRESEFARTAEGQAFLSKIDGYARKIRNGGSGLTDREREDLYNSMSIMYNASKNTYKGVEQEYTDMALRYGINPQDIIRTGTQRKQQTQTNGQINVNTQTAYPDGTVIKNKQGQRMIMRNGQWQKM